MKMGVAVITGCAGLIGAEAVRQFAGKGLAVVGIDNDMRRSFFGDDASTHWARAHLERTVAGYRHVDADIRDEDAMRKVFSTYKRDIAVVVHAAAQPSHDWAARDPVIDFTVNANGTLNLLMMTRQHAPTRLFIFMQTNKVYGDTPNRLPLIELETRWELRPSTRRPSTASTRPCRSTRRRTACSAPRKRPPMCWCRNTAAISA